MEAGYPYINIDLLRTHAVRFGDKLHIRDVRDAIDSAIREYKKTNLLACDKNWNAYSAFYYIAGNIVMCTSQKPDGYCAITWDDLLTLSSPVEPFGDEIFKILHIQEEQI